MNEETGFVPFLLIFLLLLPHPILCTSNGSRVAETSFFSLEETVTSSIRSLLSFLSSVWNQVADICSGFFLDCVSSPDRGSDGDLRQPIPLPRPRQSTRRRQSYQSVKLPTTGQSSFSANQRYNCRAIEGSRVIDDAVLSCFRRGILHRHNILRQSVGLDPLQWSTALTNGVHYHLVQQKKYDQCRMAHSSMSLRANVGQFKACGENLYRRDINGSQLRGPSGGNVTEAWYMEKKCYRYGQFGDPCTKELSTSCRSVLKKISDPMGRIQVGHFTQMMWQRTTHIGCSLIQCGGSSYFRGSASRIVFLAGCWYGSTRDECGGNSRGDVPFDRHVAKSLNLASGWVSCTDGW